MTANGVRWSRADAVCPKAVRRLFSSGYAPKMRALGSKTKGEAMSESAGR